MKLPWQNSRDSSPTSASTPAEAEATDAPEAAPEAPEPSYPKGYTPPKGHATPKRRDSQVQAHSLAPATGNQARADRKKLKESMTKEEWKQYRAKEREKSRAQARERQEAMDRGDERYLLPRDKGEERAFVRDWVDARRFVNNYVMPAAIALLVVMLLGNVAPTFASIVSIIALVLILIFAIEGVILGSRSNRAVREKFPNSTAAGIGLGFYAYSRATQPRRWRTPRPRVALGDKV